MLNPTFIENAAPAGFGVLELVVDPAADAGAPVIERPPRPHWLHGERPVAARAALERTELLGRVTGPVAAFRLVQRFRVPPALAGAGTLEARYRFPLPGDAVVTGAVVRFGETEVRTALAAREDARATYDAAREAGHQAALLELEAPDVFTLSVAGLRDGEAIEVETRYVQRAALAGGRWSVRVPLTTAPRFVRDDERGLPQARANPLATLRDPGHRFALDVVFDGGDRAMAVTSPTHALRADAIGAHAVRVRLAEPEVIPDRDCVLEWRLPQEERAGLGVGVEDGPDGAWRYVLALVRPPRPDAARALPRDLVLLVDRSGSMSGPKWDATCWAVRRLLAGLGAEDRVQLGAFDDRTVWLDGGAVAVDERARRRVEEFLRAHGPNGGTELGVALEGALLARPRMAGAAVARHCLVLTDGQVTDRGRILATVDAEAARPDARRVSVLCIDSAPNASLATSLAERGRGTAHFLSSNPSDGDVATALEDVLEGFDAPLAVGLTLAVDRAGAQAPGRPVVEEPGVSVVELGDLVTGRPVWVTLRLPAADAAGATLRVSGPGVPELVASLDGATTSEGASDAASGVAGGVGDDVPDGAVRALFGAERVRVLEQLAAAHDDLATLGGRLERLGYAAEAAAVRGGAGGARSAENALASAQTTVRALLVRESLETGVPSTATALVAVRAVAGEAPTRRVDVACALPAGWSSDFETLARAGMPDLSGIALFSPMSPASPAPRMQRSMARPAPSDHDGGGGVRFSPARIAKRGRDRLSPQQGAAGADDASGAPLAEAAPAYAPRVSTPLWTGVPAVGPDGEAVLHDSPSGGDEGGSVPDHISVALLHLDGDAGALPAGTRLLIFVDDLARPAARVDVRATLLAGGRRPLNVRVAPGARVRVVLALPPGVAWPAGAGALAVTLA
jgi:Ca-activated chloride channel homolog